MLISGFTKNVLLVASLAGVSSAAFAKTWCGENWYLRAGILGASSKLKVQKVCYKQLLPLAKEANENGKNFSGKNVAEIKLWIVGESSPVINFTDIVPEIVNDGTSTLSEFAGLGLLIKRDFFSESSQGGKTVVLQGEISFTGSYRSKQEWDRASPSVVVPQSLRSFSNRVYDSIAVEQFVEVAD